MRYATYTFSFFIISSSSCMLHQLSLSLQTLKPNLKLVSHWLQTTKCSLQYIKSFINSSWYDRYENPPPPKMATMIWSLMVSMYAVAGLCGALSVKLITGRLGRWVRDLKQCYFLYPDYTYMIWKDMCSLTRKKAMICNSFIAIVAGGLMLASKGAKSYEMVIVARILYGFSSGKPTGHILWQA